MNKSDYKRLVNDFLIETEKEDKNKMPWETKNHVPILHKSLNEFYGYLLKKYFNKSKVKKDCPICDKEMISQVVKQHHCKECKEHFTTT